VSRAVMGASRWLEPSSPFGIKTTPAARTMTIDTMTAAAVDTRRFLMVCSLSIRLTCSFSRAVVQRAPRKRKQPSKSDPLTSPEKTAMPPVAGSNRRQAEFPSCSLFSSGGFDAIDLNRLVVGQGTAHFHFHAHLVFPDRVLIGDGDNVLGRRVDENILPAALDA